MLFEFDEEELEVLAFEWPELEIPTVLMERAMELRAAIRFVARQAEFLVRTGKAKRVAIWWRAPAAGEEVGELLAVRDAIVPIQPPGGWKPIPGRFIPAEIPFGRIAAYVEQAVAKLPLIQTTE